MVDIGFAQYNAGGTELTNDTGPSGGGNNFCMGGKRIGRRTYEQVHTFFVLTPPEEQSLLPLNGHLSRSAETGTRSRENGIRITMIFPEMSYRALILRAH